MNPLGAVQFGFLSVFPLRMGLQSPGSYGLGPQPSPPNNTWSTFTMGAVTPRGLIAPKIR